MGRRLRKGRPAGGVVRLPQRVQVHYRHAQSSRAYTYEWNGREALVNGDIVILPPTSTNPGDHWVLGIVVSETSDYDGEIAPVLYAIRGEFLR
jgi:hypothetical protein